MRPYPWASATIRVITPPSSLNSGSGLRMRNLGPDSEIARTPEMPRGRRNAVVRWAPSLEWQHETSPPSISASRRGRRRAARGPNRNGASLPDAAGADRRNFNFVRDIAPVVGIIRVPRSKGSASIISGPDRSRIHGLCQSESWKNQSRRAAEKRDEVAPSHLQMTHRPSLRGLQGGNR